MKHHRKTQEDMVKETSNNKGYQNHKLPTFNGETIVEFLDHFNRLKTLYKWPSGTSLQILQMHLEGPAASWLQNQPEETISDVDVLQKQLKEYYNSESTRDGRPIHFGTIC